MKASLCYYLIVLSCSLALALPSLAQSGQYTVQVDSMTAQDAAEGKVQQLKAQGLNAYWLKSTVPGQGLRFRVRIGRFASRAAAQSYGAKLKQQGLTSDFFAALYEGTSSPLGNDQTAKKTTPAPAVVKPVPVIQPPPPRVEEKNSITVVPAQRKREVNTTPAANNSIVEKPAVNPAANTDATRKPVTVPPTVVTPKITPPSNNAAPKSVPPVEVKPIKTTPTQTAPALPTPLNEVKPPRDKKAENVIPTETKKTETLGNKVAELPKPMKETIAAATTPAPAVVTYTKFEDRSFGYSFERPGHWSGGTLPTDDLQAQRIDAGAIFRSQEDAAFSHAIWNSLKNANSPAYDNNLIVDLVIKSIGNSEGMQGLTETARRMAQEGDQIKTFVDLRTMFRQPRVNSLLEFQGKAVIIRASTGILLVVAFYSKDSAPTMMGVVDKIISSAHIP